MKAGSDPQLKKLLLREHKLLKDYPLPEHILASAEQRQNFMRRWQSSLEGEGIFLWQPGQGRQSLLLLQASPDFNSGSRVIVYLPPEGNYQAEDFLGLCRDLFTHFPQFYDLEVKVISPDLPDFRVQDQLQASGLETWLYKAGIHPWPHYSWGFYLRRLALVCHFQHVSFHNFGILIEEDSQGEHLIEVSFLRSGQILAVGPAAFYLNDLGILDQDLRYRPQALLETKKTKLNYSPLLLEAKHQVQAYLCGKITNLELPLKYNRGTDFQKQVWEQIRHIPYGSTWSYGDLAAKVVGQDKAHSYARAVGNACGSNPLALFIPCHRVVGKDGQLVGFGGGVDLKEILLNLEIFNYRKYQEQS